MKTKNKEILPGWILNVDEFSPGGYRVTLTDVDGRKAEIVDDYNELTLDKCMGYAFDIERQTKRSWNKFLYDFFYLRLKDITIYEHEYHDKAFGSWIILTKHKRLLMDGRDGRLTYEEDQNSDWVEKEAIEDSKRVTYEEFKRFVKKME